MEDGGLIVMGDLPRERWSHYDGWPTQMKVVVSLWWVTYPDGKKKNGLIIMGDLPKWKMKSGLIVMGDLPKWKEKWSHCYGWPTQRKMQRFFQKKWSHCYGWPTQKKWWSHYNGWPTQIKDVGLIVMGDLPRKDEEWSCCNGWPTQRKMLVRTQRHTRKEVGLENALPEKWGLKGALKRR